MSWGKPKSTKYTARIKIEGTVKAALLADVVQNITNMDGGIGAISANVVNNTRTRIIAEVQVRDLEHLYRIIAKLNTISGIIEIIRG